MGRFIKKTQKGFTLTELLVGVAVSIVIIVGVYNAYVSVYHVIQKSRIKISATDLANEQMEIIRNLPYSLVGTVGGVPNGVINHIQTLTRDNTIFTVTTTVRNYDDPFDGTIGGTPNDLSPADAKVVEVEITCDTCTNFVPLVFSTKVSPKNLETASTNGALFVRVFDANGNPVPQAQVYIYNASSSITIMDETNNSGLLAIIDAPPGVNTYQVSVTKNGYSSDQTATSTVSNPNPTKPNATVVTQQVTSLSFIIDKLSTATVDTVTDTCTPVPSVPFTVQGTKTIGTNPVLFKYNQSKTTNGSGTVTLSSLEWDTYSFSLGGTIYDLIGSNPLVAVPVLPDSVQNIDLIVAPRNPKTLVVSVKDATNNLPLSDAEVTISSGGGFSADRITGKGFVSQTDWSGGGGQATSTDQTKFFSSDGNIEPVSGDVVLKNILGTYQSDGVLDSSSFFIGGANLKDISWLPLDQATSTGLNSVKFQIASSDTGGPWSFTGPDGTSATYYTTSNRNIHSMHNGKQYFRYKLFLHTDDQAITPNVSDVSFTFTTSCTPPGQVSFQGLTQPSYTLVVSRAGYETQTLTVSTPDNWQIIDVPLIPQ
jgi:prepilin-type N-terminal cleavage/methylation domain-containing protein